MSQDGPHLNALLDGALYVSELMMETPETAPEETPVDGDLIAKGTRDIIAGIRHTEVHTNWSTDQIIAASGFHPEFVMQAIK